MRVITTSAKEEIEKIKEAEKEAVLAVKSAQERAEKMQQKAREEAELYMHQASDKAREEIFAYRSRKIEQAKQTAAEIILEANESAHLMEIEYKKRIPRAASHIAGQVTGMDHVLPRRDEKGGNWSP